MIITEERIRRIVKEEIRIVLLEANPYHDKEGKLSAGGTGDVYSITSPASKKYGNEAKKGKIGKNGRLGYKFGMPSKCGRKHIDGRDIDPKTSCSNYPKPYYQKAVAEGLDLSADTELELHGDELCFSIKDIKQAFMRRVHEAQQASGSSEEARCRQLGFTTFQDLLNSLNSATLAAKGELYKGSKDGK